MSRVTPGVYAELRVFVLAHRDCGDLRGDADPLTPERYRLWVGCACGAGVERWVAEEDAEADLLRSALLTFEN